MENFNRLFKSCSFQRRGPIHHFFDPMPGQRIHITTPSHPINHNHKMSQIDIDTICGQNTVHFPHQCRPRRFNPIRSSNSKDIIALSSFLVNGQQPFQEMEVNPFRINHKFAPLCPNMDFWNKSRTFNGSIHHHFGIFKKVLLDPHIQMHGTN